MNNSMQKESELNQSIESNKMYNKKTYICVYVLGNNKYFLDKTYDYEDNIRMHRDGCGGYITSMNRPCYYLEHIEVNSQQHMDEFVNFYKNKYGSINVTFRN